MSDLTPLFPDVAERKFRFILLSVFPPGMHTYEIEQAFSARGHEVFTAGLGGDPTDFNQLMRDRYPDYRFDLITQERTPISDIVAAAGGAGFLLFIEPHRAYLPPDIEDCEIPTIFLMGDDRINADWGLALYDRFDLGLTSVHAHFRGYQARGLDHIRWWHCWAAPGFINNLHLERSDDFVFVGNLHPVIQRDRNLVVERITRLAREGYGVNVRTRLWFDDYNRALNLGKTTYAGGVAEHFAMRVFESMTAGCLVIAPQPSNPDDPIVAAFESGREIVYVESAEEAMAAVRRFAHDEDARREIAGAAERKVRAQFTYGHAIDRFVADVLPQIPNDFRARRSERLAQIDDSPTSRRFARAHMAAGVGDPEVAGRLLDDTAPGDRDAAWLNARGVVYALNGQRIEAAALLSDATAHQPADVPARVNLASVRAHQILMDGAPAEAGVVEDAIELIDHTEPAALSSGLATFWYPQGYDRPRMELSAAIIELTPGAELERRIIDLLRFRLYSFAAAIDARRADVAAAGRHLEQAAAILPDDGYTRLALGEVLTAQGRRSAAARTYRTAAELEPFHAVAQLKVAHGDITHGRFSTAVQALESLLEFSPVLTEPERAEALALIGIAASRGRDLTRARAALEESLAVAPNQPAIRDLLSQLSADEQPVGGDELGGGPQNATPSDKPRSRPAARMRASILVAAADRLQRRNVDALHPIRAGLVARTEGGSCRGMDLAISPSAQHSHGQRERSARERATHARPRNQPTVTQVGLLQAMWPLSCSTRT